MDWCIVLMEMPLTRFKECWPLPKESLPELSLNLNIVTLNLTLWPINSGVLTSLLLPHLSSSLTDSLPSLNLLCHPKTDSCMMVEKQSEAFHTFQWHFFPSLKYNFITYRSSKVQIAFLKFTSCDNQALVGCIPIPAVAVHLKQKS